MIIRICFLILFLQCMAAGIQAQQPATIRDTLFPYKEMPAVFPGTKPLIWSGDLSVRMLDGAHRYIEEKIAQAANFRNKLWKRDLHSAAAYRQSIEPNRKRFMQSIGVVDKSQPYENYNVGLPEKHPEVVLQKFSENNNSEIIAETATYRIYQVRWPVLERVYGEGLLLQPKSKPIGSIIALPDADQQPEQITGLRPGVPAASQFARHLAENGYQVLVPVLISRTLLFPGRDKQQTYREWLYRQAFHMGRHIIGYEVQKVLSAIDWFKQQDGQAKIGVAGYGEGGLIAFYAAAVDSRIDAVMVSGYFNNRQKVWDEPVYRNVWGLLSEFGDAEIAALIAPRPLVVEHSTFPEIIDQLTPPDAKKFVIEGLPYTGYKGKLSTPEFKVVQAEYNRIDELTKKGFQPRSLISGSGNRPVSFGSKEALQAFTGYLSNKSSIIISNDIPKDTRSTVDIEARQVRQVKEIEDHVQWLVRDSDQKRKNFFLYKVMPEFADRSWSTRPYHPFFSVDRFTDKARDYRQYFSEEIIGRFTDSMSPFNTQTRKLFDKERWTGYEVVLDVYNDLFATGILLIPKDVKAGEKRPVVVCQHGRSSVPHKLVEGNFTAYNNTAAKLADQGFIVYVPQNPYRGEDHYRWLHRKANSVKKTLFSFIVAQHDQTLRWLSTLPFVDRSRIAFYGLSYGGQTAMRVPSILEGYCLSICAGDFGDWTRKVTDTHYPGSFVNTIEWEMPYFNMGSTFSYAEMAYLIFPRPFMVERGHHDMVQPDEWVAYEYGKVKYFYDQFNKGDKTDIEFFNGGHSMKGEGTFRFLHKHLNWP